MLSGAAAFLLDSGDSCSNLDALLTCTINAQRFRIVLQNLQRRFDMYTSTCPTPFIAARLVVTPEIRIQSERYLPVAEISSAFNLLYCSALSYSPILSSTPFHNALSWADIFVELPPYLQFSVNPACLLEELLTDATLLTRFLFTSFLPPRFYGAFGRYPEQQGYLCNWLETRKPGTLRCLDAACGTGEETYGLALTLHDHGFLPENVRIEGWTVEPLEVWAATYRTYPHDRRREAQLLQETSILCQLGYQHRINFHCRDIVKATSPSLLHLKKGDATSDRNELFDLVLCNGLLGGPIIHDKDALNRAVACLTQVLAPGGILLAADNFHGGWKQKCPQKDLRALFETYGLKTVEIGAGIGGLKPD